MLWQLVGLRRKVELAEAKSVLHPLDVLSESVLAGQLSRELEVVDLLVVLHRLINVLLVLEADTSPQQIPLVLISLSNVLRL